MMINESRNFWCDTQLKYKTLVSLGYLLLGHPFFFHFLKKLGFTPCKAEQPLQGMEIQEKEAQKY